MNCNEVRELLVRFDDGELDRGPAGQVEGHLEACADCSRELAALRGAMRLVGDCLAGPKPASAGRPPVNGVARRSHRPRWAALAAAAALALAAGGLGMLVFRPPQEASAAEIAREALAVLEKHANVRYRLSFVLDGGKLKPAGSLVIEPGGRSLLRYTMMGMDFLMGRDGKSFWSGTFTHPGDPGSFVVWPAGRKGDGGEGRAPIVGQAQVPDFQAWLESLKEDGSKLTIKLREKLGDRECTVIRSEPPAELGLKASVTFWVDDHDRSIRRVEEDVAGLMHWRLDLEAVDVQVAEDFYEFGGHATASSRVTRMSEEPEAAR